MPITISFPFYIPTNVVEVGNEISQAKLDEINAGAVALQPWVNGNFAPIGSTGGIGEAPADGQLYARYNNSWLSFVPNGGGGGYSGSDVSFWLTQGISYQQPVNIATGYVLSWDGERLNWVPQSGSNGGGIEEAPNDGNAYVRQSSSWQLFSNFDQIGNGGGGINDAPSDDTPYVRYNGSWSPFSNFDQTGGGGGGISTNDISYWLTQNNSGNQPYNINAGRVLSWNGSNLEWIDLPSGGGGGGGIGDAPYDYNYYLRYNGNWTQAQLVWSMDTYGNWRNFVCV